MKLPVILIAASVVTWGQELKPCPGVSTEPIPVSMCLALGNGPVTEPDKAMQEELDAAWERFLDDATARKPQPRN